MLQVRAALPGVRRRRRDPLRHVPVRARAQGAEPEPALRVRELPRLGPLLPAAPVPHDGVPRDADRVHRAHQGPRLPHGDDLGVPAVQGHDYIFFCHPEDQKVPKDERRAWYHAARALHGRGHGRQHHQPYDEYFKDPEKDATCVPYFEGDYWIGEAENIIKTPRTSRPAATRARRRTRRRRARRRRARRPRTRRAAARRRLGRGGRRPRLAHAAHGQDHRADEGGLHGRDLQPRCFGK